jgi:hypothetical protein
MRLREHLSYANVTATLCLGLVLSGGTAYAAGTLAKNSVGPQQIRANAVGTSELRNGAVGTKQLAPHAVGTDAMEDLAIKTQQIADSAIKAQQIADNVITSKKIAEQAIVGNLLARDAVSSDKIAPGAVSTDKLAPAAVDSLAKPRAYGYVDAGGTLAPGRSSGNVSVDAYALGYYCVTPAAGSGLSKSTTTIIAMVDRGTDAAAPAIVQQLRSGSPDPLCDGFDLYVQTFDSASKTWVRANLPISFVIP